MSGRANGAASSRASSVDPPRRNVSSSSLHSLALPAKDPLTTSTSSLGAATCLGPSSSSSPAPNPRKNSAGPESLLFPQEILSNLLRQGLFNNLADIPDSNFPSTPLRLRSSNIVVNNASRRTDSDAADALSKRYLLATCHVFVFVAGFLKCASINHILGPYRSQRAEIGGGLSALLVSTSFPPSLLAATPCPRHRSPAEEHA